MAFQYKIDRRGRYKYTATERYGMYVPALKGAPDFDLPFAKLQTGHLSILPGYASDGPSGPTIDTPDAIRAAFFHDVLYQAMNADLIPWTYRRAADKLLVHLAREDGMPLWRALIWYRSLRIFGRAFAIWGRVRPRRTGKA